MIKLIFLGFLLGCFGGVASAAPLESPAIGYSTLTYKLPDIGSYQLPVINHAADGQVIDSKGRETTLHQLYQKKYTLMGFIYSNCGDVNGCPLSSYVFYKLKSMMQKDEILSSNLRLLSLSFDPARDTPKVMDLYGKNFDYAGPKGEWHFLTTSSEASLFPLLKDYKQDIQREMTVNGKPGETIAHVLRVFLIDPDKNIRNIYSVEFLHPDIIANDLKTLLAQADNPKLTHASYKTLQTQPVQQRQGQSADLLGLAKQPPLGLPALKPALLSTLTRDKIALGRKLFFDRRLSLNNTMSCAMCHVPEQGFTSNEIATAVGFEGRSVRRNSPTLYNIAYAKKLFHDGREDSLIQQVWAPFLARNEMANPSVAAVINKIRSLKDYRGLFEGAFTDGAVSMETVGEALAAYQQTLLSADSPFDRWHYGKRSVEDAGISAAAQAGFRLFTGKARCHSCHTIGSESATFSNDGMHNTGLGYQRSMGIKPAKKSVMLAPGVFVDVDQSIIDSVSETPPADTGYYEITQNPADRWKYKTPSLRNLTLTAPYMHDGSMSSIREVVEFYNRGGIANPNLDPLITPLHLSDTEIAELVAFLESLTGSNADQLVADAYAAPIGDTGTEDDETDNEVGGNFNLVDHHGRPFELKQLRGKIAMLFFGYTHCPDVCPTELASLARILKQLDPADAEKVQGLFVSVDPTRDTPEVLSQYVPYFHADLIGLSGTETAVQQVMDAYRAHSTVDKNKRNDGQYFVDHSANLYIIDEKGKLAQIIPFGFPEDHILDIIKTRLAALRNDC